MSTTETPQFAVTFDDPEEAKRTKRPWHELYPDAKAYVDGTIDAFLKAFGKESDGFARKLTGYSIPLERDSEHPEQRAVRLINDRCDARKAKCHAQIRNSAVHMVIGKRVVKPRAKRTANADSNGSDTTE